MTQPALLGSAVPQGLALHVKYHFSRCSACLVPALPTLVPQGTPVSWISLSSEPALCQACTPHCEWPPFKSSHLKVGFEAKRYKLATSPAHRKWFKWLLCLHDWMSHSYQQPRFWRPFNDLGKLLAIWFSYYPPTGNSHHGQGLRINNYRKAYFPKLNINRIKLILMGFYFLNFPLQSAFVCLFLSTMTTGFFYSKR